MGTKELIAKARVKSANLMGFLDSDFAPDYYLTTVWKDTKKPGSHCAAMAPRFAPFSLCICAKPLKPLGHQHSSVDGLITPTSILSPTELHPANHFGARVLEFRDS